MTVVVEETVPEAPEGETSRRGALFFTSGFALRAVAVYVPQDRAVPVEAQERS